MLSGTVLAAAVKADLVSKGFLTSDGVKRDDFIDSLCTSIVNHITVNGVATVDGKTGTIS